MTFAEILIFILVIIGFFILMNPLRQRLEHYIYKAFKIPKKNKHKDVPLTPKDYTQKENKPDE